MSAPAKTVQKKEELATKVSQAFKIGRTARVYKARPSVHFFRPHTKITASKPAYERDPLPKAPRSAFDILRYPIKSAANAQLIEKANTIVFIVDQKANKQQIKEAFKSVFGCTVAKVNTLITPHGEKKAFIKLPSDVNAVDISSKIGIN